MATTPGYNPKKASTFNQLRQAGLSEDAALKQAGITDVEVNNYAVGLDGQMGALIIGTGTRPGVEVVRNVDYDVKADAPVSSKTPTNYTTTSTETVSGGGSTTIIAGARQPTPASQAFATAGDAKQAEIDQFIKDNPSNFARKKQGLPPLSPEEAEARNAKLNTLQDQRGQIYNKQVDAETATPGTITTVPNTTTTTQTVTSGTTSVNTAVPSPAGADPVTNQQTEQQLGVAVGASNVEIEPGAVDEFGDIDAQIAANENDLQEPPLLSPGEVDEEIFNAGEPPLLSPEEVDEEIFNAGIDVDAEIERAAAEGVENFEPEDVDEFAGIDEQIAANENDLQEPPLLSPEEIDAEIFNAGIDVDAEIERARDEGADQADGEREYATRALAQKQATLQAQRKQANDGDWRVKLRLAPAASYLYKAEEPGILQPLAITDGVVFPYTPQINTNYQANYSTYDLTHSNYRGYFYQNSYVGEIAIQATFTAQDTYEANYLLAVIHFFRSVTKMFYGQDAERGAPPPLVYLQGLGQYQFNLAPCVVSQFTYNLPTDVDYIRAGSTNINGTDLQFRRDRQNLPTNPFSSAWQRLTTAGLSKGGLFNPPAPATLGTDRPTYVPTKIDLSLTLLPMQSREQVSKQFSLKQFANGDLLKGGFW